MKKEGKNELSHFVTVDSSNLIVREEELKLSIERV